MPKLSRFIALFTLVAACGEDSDAVRSMADPTLGATDAGASSDAGGATATPASALTYWQDMVPLFEAHCLQCHQQGGVAPFRLDEYAEAKAKAALIAHSTRARTMPPWGVTADGTCGDFQHSLALDDVQIERIAAWAEGGAQEGQPGVVRAPAIETLASAKEYATPTFAPEIAGGALAEADEYRCFQLDTNTDALSFITGYEIVPGASEIVHHVVVSVVDPDAPAEAPAAAETTNRQVMEALDLESPDRLGWPCYGLAGDGVAVSSVPVVWAPGQGVVRFPGASGVPLAPQRKLVVQVHYNLADPAQRGQTDQTKVRLQLASQVENVGIFALPDPLLGSLQNERPDVLPPGKASHVYTWKRTMKELGLDSLPELSLYGVMPHMHQRGHRYQMRVKTGEAAPMQCAADVQRWDFHWQRMYFYQKPWTLTPGAELEVACDFDTTDATEPVLPGWGTRNEMCLATLYLTVPAKLAGF